MDNSEYNDLVIENIELRKKLNKARKEKKRWKKKALIYKSGLTNVKKLLEEMRNDMRGDSNGRN